jgi:hypothetical protein
MQRQYFLAIALTGAFVFLGGCGSGGSGDTSPDPTPTPSATPTPGGGSFRTTLAGTGSGATVTSKIWRIKSLRPNGFYSGTGADQTCPVSIERKDGSGSVSCVGAGNITFFSNETTSDATGGPRINGTWTLSGNTFATTLGTGALRVVSVYALTDEGKTDFGGGRVRFRLVSKTESGSSTQDPEEVGNEFVLEELVALNN